MKIGNGGWYCELCECGPGHRGEVAFHEKFCAKAQELKRILGGITDERVAGAVFGVATWDRDLEHKWGEFGNPFCIVERFGVAKEVISAVADLTQGMTQREMHERFDILLMHLDPSRYWGGSMGDSSEDGRYAHPTSTEN